MGLAGGVNRLTGTVSYFDKHSFNKIYLAFPLIKVGQMRDVDQTFIFFGGGADKYSD